MPLRKTRFHEVSAALKQCPHPLQQQVQATSAQRPYDLYTQLDLGPGDYACLPSTQVCRGLPASLRKKLRK